MEERQCGQTRAMRVKENKEPKITPILFLLLKEENQGICVHYQFYANEDFLKIEKYPASKFHF